jgi:hypothetical protein
MDTAIIVALVGIVGTLIASLIGIFGTLHSQRRATESAARSQQRQLDHNSDQAEKQRTHELALKRQEQLRQERISAYMELAGLTRMIDPTEPHTFVDLSSPLSKIELVASDPAVVEAARTLYGDAYWARKKAREIHRDEGRDPTEDEDFLNLYYAAQESRKEFLKQAKRDLAE